MKRSARDQPGERVDRVLPREEQGWVHPPGLTSHFPFRFRTRTHTAGPGAGCDRAPLRFPGLGTISRLVEVLARDSLLRD